VRPELLLSYDFESGECVLTCQVRYFPENRPEDWDWQARFEGLEKDHKRLSQEYVLAQSALYAAANSAQSLLEIATQNDALKAELAKERNAVTRLTGKLREKETRKSKAEVLLLQAETRCKDLLTLNTTLEKRVLDLERTVKEANYRVEREKETASSCELTAKQRDEQVRKLLNRLKQQELALEATQDELRKREALQAAFSRRQKEPPPDTKSHHTAESQMKELRSRLQERETELEILKSMMKNAQKTKERVSKPASDLHLPQIRTASMASPPRRFNRSRFPAQIDAESGKKPRMKEGSEGKYRSKSPLLGPEDYSDLPEVDFNPEQGSEVTGLKAEAVE